MTRGKMISGIGANREHEKLRQRGYTDAMDDKAPQSKEPAYLTGYRGAQKRKAQDAQA